MTALVIGLALASAGFAAASLRLPSLVSTALAGYLALVANLGAVTWALSPFHGVTRTGLTVAEAALAALAFAAWWLRGRPGVDLAGVRGALRLVAHDPVTLVFVGGLVLVLGYELMLALAVPPNNYDSLTYHLSRAAAWKQEGGIHWIANAPTARMNEFQPLAEQEILFLFVAAGSGALFALPQYVAQLAILVAVYGASRRLGFDQNASARGAALLAAFSAVALQATTAQNDLVAASFPIVAACLLLGGGEAEAVLAGVALGLGLGAKLTTVLVWPVIAWLCWMGGAKMIKRTAWGAAGGLLGVGIWGFVLNLAHTGHILGHGEGRVDQSVSPSVVGTLHTSARLVYRTLDVGLLSNVQIWGLAVAGIGAGVVCFVVARRTSGRREASFLAAAVAIPLLAPLLVLGLAPAVAWFTRVAHIPVHDPIYGFSLNRDANEDSSAFGAAGALALIAAPILAIRARRSDRRLLVFALAGPTLPAPARPLCQVQHLADALPARPGRADRTALRISRHPSRGCGGRARRRRDGRSSTRSKATPRSRCPARWWRGRGNSAVRTRFRRARHSRWAGRRPRGCAPTTGSCPPGPASGRCSIRTNGRIRSGGRGSSTESCSSRRSPLSRPRIAKISATWWSAPAPTRRFRDGSAPQGGSSFRSPATGRSPSRRTSGPVAARLDPGLYFAAPADVAQLVERDLAKVEVVGSSPIIRFRRNPR